MLTIVRFSSIVVTGLAAVAPIAQLFELSNKIGLSKSDYLIVQRNYDGWWMVGLLLPLALLVNLASAWLEMIEGP